MEAEVPYFYSSYNMILKKGHSFVSLGRLSMTKPRYDI